ncbi:MAG: hypothetical protein HY365_01925 [Candidatus Aenigmarchaeota archaeon]|nr:hypothetical protein [Candidatus Aenigmarchaeota archaeon]
MRSLVLFDVGGVLLRLRFARFYRQAGKIAGISPEEFKARYVSANLPQRGFTGEMRFRQYVKELNKILNAKISYREAEKLVSLHLGAPIAGMLRLKKRLHEKGYCVGILSNVSEFAYKITMKKCPEIFDVFSSVNPRILSFRTGFRKPQSAIYKKIRGYDTVVFIDDKAAYVKEGIKHGWKGVVFTAFIDSEEASRAQDGDMRTPKGAKVARSMKELKEALRSYGIDA